MIIKGEFGVDVTSRSFPEFLLFINEFLILTSLESLEVMSK